MPKRGPTRGIDQRAQALVNQLLADHFEVYERRPDYGFDHAVAPVGSDDEVAGCEASVQLKGHARKRPRKDGYVQEKGIRLDHLRYWRAHRQPVFLVVTSNSDNVAWYLFIQQYLAEIEAKGESWDSDRTTTTILIPDSNRLTAEAFVGRFWDSVEYIKDLWPGSPTRAVEEREKELQQRDSRLRVSVLAATGYQAVHIEAAHEPVTCKLQLTPRDKEFATNQYREFVKRGAPLDIDVDDILVTGSPVFDDLSGPGRFIFDPGAKSSQLIVTPRTIDERLGPHMPLVLEAEGRGGSEGYYLIAKDDLGALQIKIEGDWSDDPNNGAFSFDFSITRWRNLPCSSISDLPALGAMLHQGGASLAVRVDGITRQIGRLPDKIPADAADVGYRLVALAKAAWLAQQSGTDITVTDDLPLDRDDELLMSEMLYELVTSGCAERAMPQAKMEVTITNGRWELLDGNPHDFRIELPEGVSKDLLGQEIQIPPHAQSLTQVRLSADSLARAQAATAEDEVSVRLDGTRDTIVRFSLLNQNAEGRVQT